VTYDQCLHAGGLPTWEHCDPPGAFD
jgi:hypothetical protein